MKEAGTVARAARPAGYCPDEAHGDAVREVFDISEVREWPNLLLGAAFSSTSVHRPEGFAKAVRGSVIRPVRNLLAVEILSAGRARPRDAFGR